MGMMLALSRSFIIESVAAFDPEAALMDVVAHTHHLPRHWRGRCGLSWSPYFLLPGFSFLCRLQRSWLCASLFPSAC